MTDRWRGRRLAGLAVVALLATLTAAAVVAGQDDARSLVMRDAAGAELARVALPPSGEFAMRYRNSVYGSLAEERFRVDDGRLRLVELGADELAVLEEYYTAVGAVRAEPGTTRAWRIRVERPLIDLPLHVQGTELGQRTLLIDGREVALWRLVMGRDDTSVILNMEDR